MSTLRVVGVSGNVTAPSRTRALLDRIIDGLGKRIPVDYEVIDISETGPLVGAALSRANLTPALEATVASIESADLIVAASPVYKGSYTGLFKHLFDFVGYEALLGTPVILAATGGSERHSLAIDHQLRTLFAFFRTYTIPTGIYATEADFDGYTVTSDAIVQRIDAALDETLRFFSPKRGAESGIRAVA
jgi:FMN reductase